MSGTGAEPAGAGTNLRPSEPHKTPPWALFGLKIGGVRVYLGSDILVLGGIGAFVLWQIQEASGTSLLPWIARNYAAVFIAVIVHELSHALVA